MLAFEFHARTRFVVGEGQLARLGQLASELKAQRVLLVSDPGIIAIGHTSCAEQILRQAGIEVSVFDGVRENPTSDDVGLGCQFAHQFQPDCIIGLGGGSSMDCAKGINFVYSNGGRIQDYWGVGKASHPMLPMIAVPTTAGTGSEAQSFALISDAETHIKMACGDKKAAFQIALLDPALTLTQPARVTALTGIDALSHALESLVTRPANAISRMLSREAWRLLSMYLPRVIDEPHDLQIRGNLQWGACLAGLAIENDVGRGPRAGQPTDGSVRDRARSSNCCCLAAYRRRELGDLPRSVYIALLKLRMSAAVTQPIVDHAKSFGEVAPKPSIPFWVVDTTARSPNRSIRLTESGCICSTAVDRTI